MKQKAVVKSGSLFKKTSKALVLLVFIGALLSVSRGVIRLFSSGERVGGAREHLEEAKLEQEELKRQLTEVTSDFYREKQTRDQLGLARPGETIIVLPDEELLRRLSPRIVEEQNYAPPEPNWQKWAKLFFEI